MKKHALTALLSLGVLVCFSQDDLTDKLGIPVRENQVIYEHIDTTAANKDQIYTAFKSALIDLYRDPDNTVQLDDKEAGIISGKSNLSFTFKLPVGRHGARAFFTYRLQAKDGKYRVQLIDWTGSEHEDATQGQPILTVYNTSGLMKNAKYRERYLTDFNQAAQDALGSFVQTIKRQLASYNQDW